MTILVENRFGNIGIASRISHILMAKAITIVTAYAAITFGGFIASGWFVLPTLFAAYILLIGFVGWDPMVAMDDYIREIDAKRSTAVEIAAAAH